MELKGKLAAEPRAAHLGNLATTLLGAPLAAWEAALTQPEIANVVLDFVDDKGVDVWTRCCVLFVRHSGS
jgi:hypothetical protein